MPIPQLATRIAQLYELGSDADVQQARDTFAQLRDELSQGKVRAAEPDMSTPTGWKVNSWVKKGILVGFRVGSVVS